MTKNHSRPAHKTNASPHPDTNYCPRSNTCWIQLQTLQEFSMISLYLFLEFSVNYLGLLWELCGNCLVIPWECQKVFKPILMDIISSTSGQNVFKSMLLDIISLTSGAKARMSSNRCSWTSTKRNASAEKMARGRRRVGSEWQPRMHEVLRLCIQNNPGQGQCTVGKII